MNKKTKSCLDYIGSKVRLAPQIVQSLEKHTSTSANGKTFTDLFAGTGAVSKWLLQNRYMKSITTNDIETYSAVICLATTRSITLRSRIYQSLNTLPGYHGFISEHCSPAGKANRKFFTTENAKRIDGMKFHITNMYKHGAISIEQKLKLIGELVIAADKVSNTASVYGAYLKKFKKTALKNIVLKPMEPGPSNTAVYNLCMDASELITEISGDILYIDPPYNQRQYSDNYHVLNYIAEENADYMFTPQGITGLPALDERNRSLYCNKRKVGKALDELLKAANFEYIVMSYNNRGLLDMVTLKMIFGANTRILGIDKIEYSNFKADNKRTYDTDRTTEYIFVAQKDSV